MPVDVLDRPTLRRAILAACVVFFVAAVGYSFLEVHSSTDTWIGLACGREIANSPAFPVNDTFSFTAAGQPSYNQNWLTHRVQYWFYSAFGPDSVVYAHWATLLLIHLLVTAATWWRTRSVPAALITGGIVAFACRDYLSARPATMGYLCMATVWAMLCATGAGRGKTPWWPLPILAAALLVWGQAHGSFTFGFGVVGLFLAQAVVLRLLYLKSDSDVMKIPTPQIVALAAVLSIAVAGSILLSPFGLENLKHGGKIRESEIFRLVNEWYPPLGESAAKVLFPPVWRFGVALAAGAALFALAGALRIATRATDIAAPRTRPPTSAERALPGRPVASNLLFDLVILGLTVGMTLWARRFGPVMFLFAGPILATWIVALARRIDEFVLRIAGTGLALAAATGAILLGVATSADIRERLILPTAKNPAATLLDRFTVTQASPLAEIEFLRRNEIAGRVFCEWTQAALVMWHHPAAKVFMDGRAQQLYDEETYRAYVAIDLSKSATPEVVLALIDGQPVGDFQTQRAPVDIVIIRQGMSQTLQKALDPQVGRTWVLAFASERGFVYLRKDSDPFRALAARLKSGQEWRPETADAMATRGEVYFNLTPPDFDAALACFKGASEADANYVVKTMPVIMRIEREAGRLPELLAYINGQIERFSTSGPGVSEEQARAIRGSLARFRDLTVRAMNAPATKPADRTP